MNITISREINIVIIEGIPGAGKTTLQQRIEERLSGRTVYHFLKKICCLVGATAGFLT